jgi:hypothetical protein
MILMVNYLNMYTAIFSFEGSTVDFFPPKIHFQSFFLKMKHNAWRDCKIDEKQEPYYFLRVIVGQKKRISSCGDVVIRVSA